MRACQLTRTWPACPLLSFDFVLHSCCHAPRQPRWCESCGDVAKPCFHFCYGDMDDLSWARLVLGADWTPKDPIVAGDESGTGRIRQVTFGMHDAGLATAKEGWRKRSGIGALG